MSILQFRVPAASATAAAACALLVLAFAYARTQTSPAPPAPFAVAHHAAGYPKFVLLGDSLTEFGLSQPGGWCTRLMAHYSRKVDVVVRGFASYNSYWLSLALEPMLIGITRNPSEVKMFTLLIGTNDYVNPPSNKHVPLDKYASNLRKLVLQLNKFSPTAKILVISPPPMSVSIIYDGEQTPENTKVYATIANAKLYRDACLATVKELQTIVGPGLASLDTWNEVFLKQQNYDFGKFNASVQLGEFFSDFRHMNAEGNRLLFEAVVKVIDDRWQELCQSKIAAVLPTDYQNAPPASAEEDDAVKNWLFE
ncbi:hypothetical protein HDU83_000220 [Entophlyctis luteolus]|nr:hypothetical protein HDU82_001373 [Entophlyctis luteolus]KAJ3349928.1 hypothetical protein HDU83_000220 [Entophlyctis luteolus]KAJ3389800.1 hypothetical protein HDU84_008291 [Entophlyctis sp. JEL0112]